MNSTLKHKLILATKQKIAGSQRKLAWFSRQKNGLYFETPGFFMGSHTSYHKDGNVFRTSPLTQNKPFLSERRIPLDDFQGWYQLGKGMIRKQALSKNPELKARDLRGKITIREVDIDAYPSETLNLFFELLEPNKLELIHGASLDPPPDADVIIFDIFDPWIITTILGHDHNLLIRPKDDGVILSYFNDRFTANKPREKYLIEAYKID